VVGVIRNDELMRFDDPRAAHVQPGDRMVYLHSHRVQEGRVLGHATDR
jgi:hypothetical protein